MALGDAWRSITPASTSKMNLMTNVSGTGSYLAGLNKPEHKIFICTSTGSGLTVNHVYLVAADGSTLIDITQSLPHIHDGSDTGGEYIKILGGNNSDITDLNLTRVTDLYEANWAAPVYWIRTVTGTGSVENKTDGTTGERSIRLRPNATSGSGATISYPYLRASFGSTELMFQAKLQIETFSSIAIHTGVNADDVTAADSNTRKLQAEICTVTNNNWWLRTANGSANSASDTGIAATANRVAIRIEHYGNAGTPSAELNIAGGTILQKTSNIPIDGNTAENNIIKHSVKNSTGADRPLLVYGSRVVFDALSSDWI